MSSQGGAGPPPPARGGAGPRAMTIASPSRAPEHAILQRVRGNRLLDQIRHSDSILQVRRTSRLLGDMAAITSVLTMNLCDMMFRFILASRRQLCGNDTASLCRPLKLLMIFAHSPSC